MYSGENFLKGGARSDSDEEYEVGSGNEVSEQEGYSSVEDGEPLSHIGSSSRLSKAIRLLTHLIIVW